MKASRKRPSRQALEERIGHRFADPELLERALTHLSAISSESERSSSYQRLEFLGDRVLGFAIAAMLMEAFPKADEGELSRRLAALVRTEACAEVAQALDLGPAIRMAGSESSSGGRRKAAILADVCEAVIGAVYLDGGIEAARALIRREWQERMLAPQRPLRDSKTMLQEWAQGRGLPPPTYREVSRQGPDHRPEFRVAVEVEGLESAEGLGASKRAAEQAAASALLLREKLTEPADG